jgi:hypothetical protein
MGDKASYSLSFLRRVFVCLGLSFSVFFVATLPNHAACMINPIPKHKKPDFHSCVFNQWSGNEFA